MTADLSPAQSDLLAAVFSGDPVYPWQPSDPEAAAQLDSLASEWDGEDIEAAIALGWQTFSQLITPPAGLDSVLNQLGQLRSRLPADLAQRLASAAIDLVHSGRPLIDQMVDCATAVLPAWNADDLAVLARPLAYSLRDGRGEILDLSLRAIPAKPWDALTDLERARLALAVASVALRAAQSEDPAES